MLIVVTARLKGSSGFIIQKERKRRAQHQIFQPAMKPLACNQLLMLFMPFSSSNIKTSAFQSFSIFMLNIAVNALKNCGGGKHTIASGWCFFFFLIKKRKS